MKNYLLSYTSRCTYNPTEMYDGYMYIRSRDAVTAKQTLFKLGERLGIDYKVHWVRLNQIVTPKKGK